MTILVPLGGFLGAGKTTTMLAAARRLETEGERVSVVTNDQGRDLVDTDLARAAGLTGVEQVTGGCFCCRFDELASVVRRLLGRVHPTVIVAEAVGSCSDLQSTVVRPLRRYYGGAFEVAPLTVIVDVRRYAELSAAWPAEGPQGAERAEGAEPVAGESDLTYVFRHQLDEADVIAVNKADLVDAAEVRGDIAHRFPHARVITYSARAGNGLDDLLVAWAELASSVDVDDRRPFAVDYARYGAAEAALAWTNQSLRVYPTGSDFAPMEWTDVFLRAFGEATADDGATIGHVKVRVSTASGTAKASLVAAGSEPSFDERCEQRAGSADVLVNARVVTGTKGMEELVARCVAAADAVAGTRSGERRGDVFLPGYPVPVHRM